MIRAAAVVLLLGALVGCGGQDDGESGGLLDGTASACDTFAAHARDGLPAEQRADVVAEVGKVVGNADQRVQDAFGPLRNTAGGADSGYRTAADGFAQACFDAGWKG